MTEIYSSKIGVVGLGYVGLPLVLAFHKKGFEVIGYDISKKRVTEIQEGIDSTNETLKADRHLLKQLRVTTELIEISSCSIFIITVPTPIDKYKNPNLGPLISATQLIGTILKPLDLVIYESTVYPGCTEEVCVPILEQHSGLTFNKDFFCGYSPERINPGDRNHRLDNTVKIVSGSTEEIAGKVEWLYNKIVEAGTYKVSSLKVAEAGKIIENVQRDINISLMNELALIFDRLGIDTLEVLEAAGTKWNFLPFRPGLVGGHCIGVDPYYLTHKAESVGYYPEVILSGRRINDNMGVFIANKVVKLMLAKGQKIKGARALILGVTFKENCPDIRNSRVVDVYYELQSFGVNVEIYDPYADSMEVEEEYALKLIKAPEGKYDSVILAVAHDAFKEIELSKLICGQESVIYDVKSILPKELVTSRL